MATYHPLVSIVIPVYNGGNYMREAIDSALAQTYSNIEIIVVNDGSNDGGETDRIARAYGDKIQYYVKENGGCASALNEGIRRMHGEWFSWLSHDDLYDPDKVKKQVEAVVENGLDTEKTVICCGTQVIDEHGAPVPHVSSSLKGLVDAKRMAGYLLAGNALNGCALLIPKKALDSLGPFDTHYTYILDLMYWIHLALSGYAYFFISDALSKNRKHSEQVSVKKRELLTKELQRFAWDVAQRTLDDRETALAAWTFCSIHSCQEGCALIGSKYAIPMRVRGISYKAKIRKNAKKVIKKILRMKY